MASYFEWQDSYSVGVRAFDQSHRQLLEITNAFVCACMNSQELERPLGLLIDLIRYTRYHFREEEELMCKTAFALYDEHRTQHDELFDRVLEFTNDFFHGRVEKSTIAQFMIDWLLIHILEEDKKYADHFARLCIG